MQVIRVLLAAVIAMLWSLLWAPQWHVVVSWIAVLAVFTVIVVILLRHGDQQMQNLLIKLLGEQIRQPKSLDILYSAFTKRVQLAIGRAQVEVWLARLAETIPADKLRKTDVGNVMPASTLNGGAGTASRPALVERDGDQVRLTVQGVAYFCVLMHGTKSSSSA